MNRRAARTRYRRRLHSAELLLEIWAMTVEGGHLLVNSANTGPRVIPDLLADTNAHLNGQYMEVH